jgi:hypothetical protein
MISVTQTLLPPLPCGERAFRRDLARDAFARRVRKSRGGEGEGGERRQELCQYFPLTRSEAKSFAATSPQRGEDWLGAS